MQMSYGEIVRSYKEAKEPKKQIGILAELNAVGKDEIAKILYDAGEISKMTYGQYQRHGKKAVKTEPTETAEVCEQVAPDGEPCRMPEKAENVHVPEAVIEMVKDTLAELKSAYGNAKKSRRAVRGAGGIPRGGDGSGQSRIISRGVSPHIGGMALTGVRFSGRRTGHLKNKAAVAALNPCMLC